MATYPIKRYALFTGGVYYAAGGFNDYEDSFDTPEEALAAEKTWNADAYFCWSHVVDTHTGQFLTEGKGQT